MSTVKTSLSVLVPVPVYNEQNLVYTSLQRLKLLEDTTHLERVARATCAISVIHDADLEYHPKDLQRIVGVFVTEEADAVYGSRFAGGEYRRVLMYPHSHLEDDASAVAPSRGGCVEIRRARQHVTDERDH